MVTVNPVVPALSPDIVTLYYTKDALLENLPVVLFYGPSVTANSTQNSSRIQAHIYSLAGFQSFARLTVAPTSPVYAAVHHLSSEKQGDEVCRGLAVSLLSYFAGIPKTTKDVLRELVARRRPNRLAPAMFDEMHAADIASKMMKAEGIEESIEYIHAALSPHMLSWVDADIILPAATIRRTMSGEGEDQTPSIGDDGLPLYQYGDFTSVIHSLGSPTFLPSSKLKRAPSRPTAHSKNRILTKEQKISLRREMCELLDTEKRYVDKVSEIVHGMAKEFRAITTSDSASSIVDRLFPDTFEGILNVNTAFHSAIEKTLEETEDEAIRDIEEAPAVADSSAAFNGRRKDATGTAAFAKTLLYWFPKFKIPYQAYMQSSTDLSQVLSDALRIDSPISIKIQEMGEQRLRSALIEPVQRLPRYSLLIENMTNLLPASHAALATLLKAKDMVTDICALDAGNTSDNTQAVTCLRRLVEDWPIDLSPRGRLITVVDIKELEPPYSEIADGVAGVLLLFSESCIMLHKKSASAFSARGIIAEVERPSTRLNPQSTETPKTLAFSASLPLQALRITQSASGRVMRLACPRTTISYNSFAYAPSTTKTIRLESAYEGKAARLCEEIAKSRIEGRHSESLRESDKWTLRTINPTSRELGVLAAIFEDTQVDDTSRAQSLGNIRVVIGGSQSTKSILATNRNIDIVICVSASGNDMYRMDCRTADGSASTDTISTEGFTCSLITALERLLRAQHHTQCRDLASVSIECNREILKAFPLHVQEDDSRGRSFRPISPVKLLSNFLNNGSSNQQSTPSKQREDFPAMKNIPRMLPPLPSSVTASRSTDSPSTSDKAATIQANTTETRDSLSTLEETLTTYVVALRSRSGNIVGRVLRGRAAADELAVNELCNALIEDPSRMQAAAEVPIDVLFVAFEKFLKGAWRDRMGPLLPNTLLGIMQTAFDLGNSDEFRQRFRFALEEMTPQNKRAFSAIIKLLADLLDASGNDGDRGALMASFAEVLIVDKVPHNYISLLDRLVEDFDTIFDTSFDGETSFSTDSLGRNRSYYTGSLSSNASSLRKRFGFGSLSRENSKSESESKVASVWRTLSKSSKNPGEPQSQPGSISKGSLLRSRSTDTDVRMCPPLRPVSRDRPATAYGTGSDQSDSRPGSSHRSLAVLSTIGENTPTKPSVLTKKKRRSSLSDLQALRDSPAAARPWTPSSPSQLRTPTNFQARSGLVRSSPRDQHKSLQASLSKPDAPPKLSLSHLGSPFGTPQPKVSSPQRFGSLQKKGPSPQATRIGSPRRVFNRSDETVIASSSPVPPKRKSPQSSIPTPKALSERSWPPNATTSPKKPQLQQPTPKLRLQSPQKLRQRLSNEQKALENSSTALQAELAAIGDELSALKLAPSSHITPIKPLNITKASPAPAPTPTTEDLSTRLTALTTTLSTQTNSTAKRLSSLSTESSTLAAQLEAANRKIKKLDALYQEANAENEALYERFNDELGKILGRVKGGEGVKVLKERVGILEGEVEGLRKEVRRERRKGVDFEG